MENNYKKKGNNLNLSGILALSLTTVSIVSIVALTYIISNKPSKNVEIIDTLHGTLNDKCNVTQTKIANVSNYKNILMHIRTGTSNFDLLQNPKNDQNTSGEATSSLTDIQVYYLTTDYSNSVVLNTDIQSQYMFGFWSTGTTDDQWNENLVATPDNGSFVLSVPPGATFVFLQFNQKNYNEKNDGVARFLEPLPDRPKGYTERPTLDFTGDDKKYIPFEYKVEIYGQPR